MRRREASRRDWPDPQPGGRDPARSYAPETALVAAAAPAAEDDRLRSLVAALPDGSGPLRRIGICNPGGVVYREVVLHGPVQLLYFWAGLNALGFQQRPAGDHGFSRYWLLFGRSDGLPLPEDAART